MQDSPLNPGLEKILLGYHHYCRQVAGFAPTTCVSRVGRARLFLEQLSANGPVELATLKPILDAELKGGAKVQASTKK